MYLLERLLGSVFHFEYHELHVTYKEFHLVGSKIVKRLRRRQYDPVIIERTIGLVLGPSTALYEPFLKHCTLTNKVVGTI